MAATKIPWAHETVNIMSGCSGPNGTPDAPKPCSYCYGRRMAARLRGMPQSAKKYRHGFRPTFHPEEIDRFSERADGWRKSRRVFVNSMSDIMDPAFSAEEIRAVIDMAEEHSEHAFLFLSKRPERYSDFDWPENAWLGASATDQDMAELAMQALSGLSVKVRYLSCEPLLGHIIMPTWPEWIIVGSMTGPKATPPKRQWVSDLVWQARQANARIFCKPNLEKHFGSDFPQREFPGG